MKPTIDQQIEAVTLAAELARDPATGFRQTIRLEAALDTLKWVKRHAPTIKSVLGEFEGAKIVAREDE